MNMNQICSKAQQGKIGAAAGQKLEVRETSRNVGQSNR